MAKLIGVHKEPVRYISDDLARPALLVSTPFSAIVSSDSNGLRRKIDAACLNVLLYNNLGSVMSSRRLSYGPLKRDAWKKILAYVNAPDRQIVYEDAANIDTFEREGMMSVSRQRISRRVRRVSYCTVERGIESANLIEVHVSLEGTAEWVTQRGEELKFLRRLSVKRDEKTPQKKIHVLSFSSRGVLLKAIASIEDPLMRDNYTDKVLKGYDRSIGQLQATNPNGRLVIIHGPPGTGKTYMIRGIVESLKGPRCVLVPSQFVSRFTDPMFGAFLLRQKTPTCLIVEDADMLLVKRAGDNMTAISALLNLADGLFGTVSDVRVVCTTNATKLEIDPALVRSGRLIEKIELSPLDAEHAGRVYKRISGEARIFGKPTILADLYNDAARREEPP